MKIYKSLRIWIYQHFGIGMDETEYLMNDTELMQTIKEIKLIELTDEYYSLVAKNHHKDSDCHFYIKKVYSYGQKPYWQFQHYGYCWSVENFFRDETNVKKYQEYFKEKKRAFNYVKDNFKFKARRKAFITDIPINLIECQKEDFNISEFPQRKTEQEAEQDMLNFLEWAIEKEKQNDNSDC